MTEYELMFIIKPTIDEAKQKEAGEKVKALIETKGGKVTNYEFIGKKDLATHFEGHAQGIYVQINYEGSAEVNEAINGYVKVAEEIIRHLILRMDAIKEKTAA